MNYHQQTKLNILITETSKTNARVRVELYEEIIERGHNIFFIFKSDQEFVNKIDNTVELKLPLRVNRNNLNPFRELKLLLSERKLLRDHKIDAVLVYGIKTIPRFVLAAKLGGVKKVICVVNGAGNLFMGDNFKKKLLRTMVFPLLFLSFRLANKVLVQNQDDYEQLLRMKLATKKRTIRVNGSGINIQKFNKSPLETNPSFLLVTRITGSKGVNEFVKAAKIVKKKYPNAIFNLVGPEDDNDESVNWLELRTAVEQGIINYHGETDNVQQFIKNNKVFVFPSYYREGIPRSIMEAMAMGRPIITTQSPGCRETVIEGVNGFLVPPRNEVALADKIQWMIENDQKLDEMGENSRKICEEKFDVNEINRIVISSLFN